MAGLDKNLENKEKEKEKRDNQMKKRKDASEEVKRKMFDTAVLEDTSSDESQDADFSGPSTSSLTSPNPCLRKRGRKNILTPEVLGSLDRAGISDRHAVHTVASVISATGQNAAEFAVNRSSVRRYRLKHRELRSKELKVEFQSHGKPLTIHWDGKLMKDLTGDEKVDRLPIVVSSDGVDQLLAVPKLSLGTGHAICDAIVQIIDDWKIKDDIKAFSFDTTAANTGRRNGACVLLEGKLGHDVLYLACRHHIHEIMLEEVFSLCISPSSSPEIQLFKRFKQFWPNIQTADFYAGIQDDAVMAQLDSETRQRTLSYATEQLHTEHPRDDYRELLEITIIFLGGVPPRGVRFMKPGAMHRARFMSRLIYSMKIFIFRNSGFHLTDCELNGLKDLCVFAVKFYIRGWFSSRLGISAPKNDLLLCKELLASGNCTSLAALKKLKGHLWYLSEVLVGFSFFDDSISVEDKRKMVKALDNPGVQEPAKRISLLDQDIGEKEIPDFVTTNTKKFFSALNISTSFFDEDPAIWRDLPAFTEAQTFVGKLRVTNDTAEQGVALIQEYSGLRTKSEEQTQFILQVVAEHKKKLPEISKVAVVESLKT
nr:uncharacterized protein LOC124819345 [Hydra vulgaris]